MNCNLIGFKRNYASRKNWGGLFSHKDKVLTSKEAHKLVDYGIAHGYATAFDIPDKEVEEILGWTK